MRLEEVILRFRHLKLLKKSLGLYCYNTTICELIVVNTDSAFLCACVCGVCLWCVVCVCVCVCDR